MRPASFFARIPPEVFLALGLAFIFLAFMPPAIFSADGNSMLAVTESIINDGDFTVPPESGVPGTGGHFYSQWYPLLSILAAPFVLIGQGFALFAGVDTHHGAVMGGLALNALLSSAAAALVVFLSKRLGGPPRLAYTAGIAYGLGTFALVYAQKFFAEPLLALCGLGAFLGAFQRSRGGIWLCLACCALAVLAKPTGVLFSPLLAAYLFLNRRSLIDTIYPLVGMLAGLVVSMVYNQIRFGSSLDFGNRPGFGLSAFFEAFPGLLLSPGYGLIWYSPVILCLLFLPKAALRKAEVLAILSLFVTLWVFYACRPVDWFGGWSWGPRFLLPALALLVPVAPLMRKRYAALLPLLAAIGLVLHLPTLFTYYERVYMLSGDGSPSGEELAWSFRSAPFLAIWPETAELLFDERKVDPSDYFNTEDTRPEGLLTETIAAWWYFLPGLGVPRLISAAVPLFLSALGGLSILWGFRLVPRDT